MLNPNKKLNDKKYVIRRNDGLFQTHDEFSENSSEAIRYNYTKAKRELSRLTNYHSAKQIPYYFEMVLIK